MSTAVDLKNIAFLRHLSEQQRDQIANIARIAEHQAEDIVFRQGQNCSEIFVTLSGDIALDVEELGEASVQVSRHGAGQLLGWSPVLGRHGMTATARALTPCRLAVLDLQSVFDLCEREPRIGMAFLWEIAVVISDRLWAARRNLARALRHRPLSTINSEGSD